MDNYREQLQEERKDIKARFIKLVEFINSDKFYELSANNKQVLKNQKIVMELYLSVLNMRVFEDVNNITVPDYGALQGIASMFCHTWNAPSSAKYLEEQLKKSEESE